MRPLATPLPIRVHATACCTPPPFLVPRASSSLRRIRMTFLILAVGKRRRDDTGLHLHGLDPLLPLLLVLRLARTEVDAQRAEGGRAARLWRAAEDIGTPGGLKSD